MVNHWKLKKYIDLYNVVNHLSVIPFLNNNIRCETIVWKTYYNFLLKIKGILDGGKCNT